MTEIYLARLTEKALARKHRKSERYTKVRKCEGTSRSLGVKGGRWVLAPGDSEHAAKGYRARRRAALRFADELAA